MSLYQRGKSWYYDFQYRGERYTGNIGPVSKTVAKEILAKKKAEAVEGRYKLPSKKPSPRLEDFVQEYFAWYAANRRPRSCTRQHVAWWALQPMFGAKRLDDLGTFDLERWRKARKEAGISNATITRDLAFLKHLYALAVKWGKAQRNPVTDITLPRLDNGRTRILSPEEETRLLACCWPHLKPLVIAALHTGFRESELLALTWQDVDGRRGVVTVQATYAKNGESRSVPMNRVLRETLRGLYAGQGPETAVFLNRHGTGYKAYDNAFRRALKRAGIHGLTFHDLRHTFASRLVMAGADLPTVQALMGHKTIQMTLRYSRLTDSHKRQAVARLEKSQQFSQQPPLPTVDTPDNVLQHKAFA